MPEGSVSGIRPTQGGTPGASDAPGGAGGPGATVARLAALPGVSTAGALARATEDGRAIGRVLPVSAALADLLPRHGLRRGDTVSVTGSTSLLLALLAEATAQGSWAAAVGLPRLGVLAAGELGVAVQRLALVPRPGAELAAVTAALLDGFDLVVVTAPRTVEGTRTARRLSARARNRGAVLLSAGPWPGAELDLRCRTVRWSGTADGHGYLRSREVEVGVSSRVASARPGRARLLLPGPDGTVAAADPPGTGSPHTDVPHTDVPHTDVPHSGDTAPAGRTPLRAVKVG